MSERKHVFRGVYAKAFKSNKSRKGFGYTHCAASDSEFYTEAMGSRNNGLSQIIIFEFKSPIKFPDSCPEFPDSDLADLKF